MPPGSQPFTAGVADYAAESEQLLTALKAGAETALMRFKWEHPRYRGRPLRDVDPGLTTLDDARLVIAREHSFNSWGELTAFAEVVARDPDVAAFESAVDALVTGDLGTLSSLVRQHPWLTQARSRRRHHATLLHYVGANGVEQGRQQTPANAVEATRMLLAAGAEVDARADLYDGQCTTLSMVISSSHPAVAGVQAALADTLLDHGAALEGRDSRNPSAVTTALAFGYLDTAKVLADRGAPIRTAAVAAGLGQLDAVQRLLPAADATTRQAALALAVQHGHLAVVELLLDAGVDPNRYNPEGHHAHSTPLHQAVSSGHFAVVRLLIESGARLDIRDTIYDGTPLAWAEYLGRPEIASYLRCR